MGGCHCTLCCHCSHLQRQQGLVPVPPWRVWGREVQGPGGGKTSVCSTQMEKGQLLEQARDPETREKELYPVGDKSE